MTLSFTSVEEELVHYKNHSADLEISLNEVRGALKDFQISSRELEEELEREIEQIEKSCADMKVKTEQLRVEADSWKEKYQQSKQEHNIAMVQMQREIELLKKAEEAFKKKTLELELDNDDLERTERAATSSLADLEMKYNKVIERNAILENEIAVKDRLAEQVQRLKDDLNDANLELERLRAKTNVQQSALDASESRTHSLQSKLANLQQQTQVACMLSLTKKSENGYGGPQKAYIPRSRIPRTPVSPGKESNPPRMVQEVVGLQSCRSFATSPPVSSIPIASPALYSPPKPSKVARGAFDSRNSPSSIRTLRIGPARPIGPATRCTPLTVKHRRANLPMRAVIRPDRS